MAEKDLTAKSLEAKADVFADIYSKFSHAAGELGCASFTRYVTVQYLLNSYKLR